MNSQKIKSDSYCVGGKHRSGTKNTTSEIIFNKKTGKRLSYKLENVLFVIEKNL